MKKLVVMRHAEAGQASRDFERTLTDYGRAQAASTASQLAEMFKADYMIVSSAERTRETSGFLIETLELKDNEYHFEKKVYEASTQDLLKVIATFPESAESVILVGHNPAVSSLVSSLTGTYEGFPTACAVILELSADDWHTVSYSDAKLSKKILPHI